MTTLKEDWKQYRDAVYPDGLSAQQEREAHAAFFAGCLTALKRTVQDTAALAPEDAQRRVLEIVMEAKAICQATFLRV